MYTRRQRATAETVRDAWPVVKFCRLLLWVAVIAQPIYATEPTERPILRPNSAQHTATIRRIAVDEEKRILVTVSEDKTIRLWNLDAGSDPRSQKILRVPIDDERDGMLYCVAISPDGATIVAGGWTCWNWEGKASLYVFDRESEKLTHRIGGLPQRPTHLAFSKDGARLVVCQRENSGVRLYKTSDWTLIGEDADYDGAVYWADFDHKGRLVTVSFDGFVRLYSSEFRFLEKSRATGGQKPSSCAFSPDGKRIAVGFDDSTSVEVISGTDLQSLFLPDTSRATNRNLSIVAWSQDGAHLWAGGTFIDVTQNEFPILRWSDEGRGSMEMLPGSRGSIRQILPLKNGGAVFAAADPAWGVLTETGERTVYVGPTIADFRNDADGLELNKSGSIIRFSIAPGGKQRAEFSVRYGTLKLNPREDEETEMTPPKFEGSGLDILGWKNSRHPTLNGKPLELEQPREISRSLAISPSEPAFLIGSDWNVYKFDSEGKKVWRKRSPGEAWALNVTLNGKIGVAAFADGTIRWFRMNDGEPLLNFFVEPESRRWICWTPSGYYMASEGGEDLAGWHMNRGKETHPDFFTFGQISDAFRRQDIVESVLSSWSEKKAITEANKRLRAENRKVIVHAVADIQPPKVQIVSPKNGASFDSEEVDIEYRVESPSGLPLKMVRVFVDGARIEPERGITITPRDTSSRSIRLWLPRRDCMVSIVVTGEIDENSSAESWPSNVSLKWTGEGIDSAGNLHILPIGVSDYSDPQINDLEYCDDDVLKFVETLRKQEGGLYRQVLSAAPLVDKTATKANILAAFGDFVKTVSSDDTVAVFVSGHGMNDDSGAYFFLPHDANPDDLAGTCISDKEILGLLGSLKGRRILFIDTCRSGNVFRSTRLSRTDTRNLVNDLSSDIYSVIVFASSTAETASEESADWGNGAFTKAVVLGIEGEADYIDDDRIEVNELGLFVPTKVQALTHLRQRPVWHRPITVPEFTIAISE